MIINQWAWTTTRHDATSKAVLENPEHGYLHGRYSSEIRVGSWSWSWAVMFVQGVVSSAKEGGKEAGREKASIARAPSLSSKRKQKLEHGPQHTLRRRLCVSRKTRKPHLLSPKRIASHRIAPTSHQPHREI